jgi:hypothetical protein
MNPAKLSLHFFWFICDFLCILQESTKLSSLFKNHNYRQDPGSFDSSQKYPKFTQNTPERLRTLQCGPWPWRAAVPGKIPVTRQSSRPGKGVEGRRISPWLGLGWSWGLQSCQWGGAVESGGGCRWSSFSDETATTTEQLMVVGAHMDARGGSRVFVWRWNRAEEGVVNGGCHGGHGGWRRYRARAGRKRWRPYIAQGRGRAFPAFVATGKRCRQGGSGQAWQARRLARRRQGVRRRCLGHGALGQGRRPGPGTVARYPLPRARYMALRPSAFEQRGHPAAARTGAGRHGSNTPARQSARGGRSTWLWLGFSWKILYRAGKNLNTKVEVQTFLYNIFKGRHMV